MVKIEEMKENVRDFDLNELPIEGGAMEGGERQVAGAEIGTRENPILIDDEMGQRRRRKQKKPMKFLLAPPPSKCKENNNRGINDDDDDDDGGDKGNGGGPRVGQTGWGRLQMSVFSR